MQIASTAATLAALFAFGVSAWGWGRLALGRDADPREEAFAATVGLGVLAFAGGVINLTRIAYEPILWSLLGIGWLLGMRSLVAARSWSASVTAIDKLKAIAMLGTGAVLGIFLLPSGAFNPTDDLQLYFYRPVQMLQSGTLGGNPFDPMGFDSLGTHSFLQSFVLLPYPLAYMNAFDAVFCAALAVGLVFELGRRAGCSNVGLGCALAALILVHPQQVNVSPVYSAVTFSLAFALAFRPGDGALRNAAPAGLIAAALLGSKTTHVPFAVLAALAILLASFFGKAGTRKAMKSSLAIGAWTVLFLAPWLLLHGSRYAATLGKAHAGDNVPMSGNPALLASYTPLHWGATVLAYDVAACVALVGATFAFRWQRGNSDAGGIALPLAGLSAGAAAAYVLATVPFDIPHAVRYNAPFLVLAVAAAILILDRRAGKLACLAAAVALAVVFTGSLRQRLEKMSAWRTTLSEPGDMRAFAGYTSWSLGSETREWVRRAQAHVPPRERMLALIACPHHLLFARNEIYVASEFGLTMPWLDLPLDADEHATRAFLEGKGIRYVVWQVGAGMKTDERLQQQLGSDYPEDRRLARFLLSFRGSLARLTRVAKVLHQEDGLIVLDLGARGGA